MNKDTLFTCSNGRKKELFHQFCSILAQTSSTTFSYMASLSFPRIAKEEKLIKKGLVLGFATVIDNNKKKKVKRLQNSNLS